MATYSTLVADKATTGSIKNWVNHDKIPSEQILTDAQAWIFERLRLREMLSQSTLSLTSGTGTASLPSDFLDPAQLYPHGGTKELPYVYEASLYQDLDSSGDLQSGTPTHWAVIGTNAVFDSAPASTLTYQLTYYAVPIALSLTNETNWLTTRFPALLRHVCIAFAYEHLKDQGLAGGEFSLAEAAIEKANDAETTQRRNQRIAKLGGTFTYSTLVADIGISGSIRNWVKDSDVPSEIILSEAEAFIYERLRAREMTSEFVASFSTGEFAEALPSDWLDPIQFLPHTASSELPYVDDSALRRFHDVAGDPPSGTPTAWAIKGSNIELDYAVTATYAARVLYYARPEALSTTNETNFLTTRFPGLIRHACLGYALIHMGETERAQVEFGHLEKAIKDAQETIDRSARNRRLAKVGSYSFSNLTGDITVEGSIKNWVGDTNVPSGQILTEAQALIYESLRTNDMVTRADFTSTEGDTEEVVPSDFLDPISLTPYGWGEPLQYFSKETHFSQWVNADGSVPDGTPNAWTLIGSNVIFDVQLIEDFNAKFIYYALPTALGTGNETNFLTTKFPSLLRHACMTIAYEHMQDSAKVRQYKELMEFDLRQARKNDDLYRRGAF